MSGRGGRGPLRTLLDMLAALLMAGVMVVALVGSGAWGAISRMYHVGDAGATVSRLTAPKGVTPDAKPLPEGDGGAASSRPQSSGGGNKTNGTGDAAAPSDDAARFRAALDELDGIHVAKARPGGYDRMERFGGWASNGCGDATTRDTILARDMTGVSKDSRCRVTSGTLHDPYTGSTIRFTRGRDTSALVQVDHVVALQDAWASGARDWTQERRIRYANSPDVLLAVDGKANMAKGVGVDFNGTSRWLAQKSGAPDIWMPDDESYRCEYMARRVDVKHDWNLSMTAREKQQSTLVLAACAAGNR